MMKIIYVTALDSSDLTDKTLKQGAGSILEMLETKALFGVQVYSHCHSKLNGDRSMRITPSWSSCPVEKEGV